MKELGTALLDLFVPAFCAGCSRPGSVVCAACRRIGLGSPVFRRTEVGPPYLEIWSAADYSGAARGIVLEFKERGSGPLGSLLTAWAVQALSVWGLSVAGPLLVVPLHSGSATRAAAGCDVPLRLARRAVGVLRRRGMNLTVVDLIGVDKRRTRQKELRARDRIARAREKPRIRAISPAAANGSVPGCVLFDDVVTTGASLVAAARAVERAGWRVIGGATLATVRPSAGGSTPAGTALTDSVS